MLWVSLSTPCSHAPRKALSVGIGDWCDQHTARTKGVFRFHVIVSSRVESRRLIVGMAVSHSWPNALVQTLQGGEARSEKGRGVGETTPNSSAKLPLRELELKCPSLQAVTRKWLSSSQGQSCKVTGRRDRMTQFLLQCFSGSVLQQVLWLFHGVT